MPIRNTSTREEEYPWGIPGDWEIEALLPDGRLVDLKNSYGIRDIVGDPNSFRVIFEAHPAYVSASEIGLRVSLTCRALTRIDAALECLDKAVDDKWGFMGATLVNRQEGFLEVHFELDFGTISIQCESLQVALEESSSDKVMIRDGDPAAGAGSVDPAEVPAPVDRAQPESRGKAARKSWRWRRPKGMGGRPDSGSDNSSEGSFA